MKLNDKMSKILIIDSCEECPYCKERIEPNCDVIGPYKEDYCSNDFHERYIVNKLHEPEEWCPLKDYEVCYKEK
jgi:hypothetical protein